MEGQLYASLGLSEAASPQDIKQAYRRLCWELHPDLDLSNADSFQSVTLAYKTLSDPSQRAAYDGHLLNEEQLKSCLAQLKTEARLQASYMTFSVAAVREREAASGGLVILKALYGALYFRGDPAASPSSYAGKILDVTIPLQCCVYNSELILFEKDKSALDGIYDPDEALPEHLKELYILYSFNGWTYEVTQCASDVVALPDPNHSVADMVGINAIAERRRLKEERRASANKSRNKRLIGRSVLLIVGVIAYRFWSRRGSR